MQELHTGLAPETLATQAGQKCRRGASTPANGVKTIPIPSTQRFAAGADSTRQPVDRTAQPAFQPSASDDALSDMSLIDNLAGFMLHTLSLLMRQSDEGVISSTVHATGPWLFS